MGATESRKHFLHCDNHLPKYAVGICLTHKKGICMSCISERNHLAIECRIKDLGDIDDRTMMCLYAKEEVRMVQKDRTEEEMETKIKKDIEEAYKKALDYIEELKVASYDVAMKKFESIKAREDEKINHFCEQMDRAIECFDSGNKQEGKTLIKRAKRENIFSELDLESASVVLEGQEESFVKVKEISKNWYQQSNSIDTGSEDDSDSDNEDGTGNDNKDGSDKDHEDECVKGHKGEHDNGQEDGSDETMGNVTKT